MHIDRSNYELWFIEYLDGNLDAVSEKEFSAFLLDNPDLAEELEGTEQARLDAPLTSFEKKETILKEKAEAVCEDRGDYLLIKQMEEGLTDEEERELTRCIEYDSNVLSRQKLFNLSRLHAPTISFPDREKLLRKKVSTRFFYQWTSAAAAALILFLIGWSQWDFSSDSPMNQGMGKMEPIEFAGFEPPEQIITPSELDVSQVISPSAPDAASNSAVALSENNPMPEGKKVREIALASMERRAISENHFPVEVPNAYEEGLRHMMPLYLELNNQNERLLAHKQKDNRAEKESFFVKGMQLMDRLGGDQVTFDKVYDEEGNFVAFNFKTGNFKLEQKVKR
jgi:hypothetical protein